MFQIKLLLSANILDIRIFLLPKKCGHQPQESHFTQALDRISVSSAPGFCDKTNSR